jgi:hypothetical protein
MRLPFMRLIQAAAVMLLAGCSLPPPSAGQRRAAANDVPENHPHPPGVISSFPPGDLSSARLRCYPNGQDTVCYRDTD